MNKNKLIFYSIWLFLLSLAPITILQNIQFSEIYKYPVITVNVLQRLVGMWAYTLLFVQIILGSFMSKLADRYGGWIYTFHVFEGLLAYSFVLLHPLLFVIFNFFAGRGIDPFYVFTQVCILCKNKAEFYYSLGRISFWLLSFGVGAALLRTSVPFLRKHWKKFHILNFFAFILIGIHSLGVGTDIGTFPFSFFHGPALVIGSGITFYKLVWRKLQKTQKSPPEAKK